jgi:hypothetical protein
LIDHMFISDIFESVVIDLFVVSGTDAKSKSSSRLPTPRRFFRVWSR